MAGGVPQLPSQESVTMVTTGTPNVPPFIQWTELQSPHSLYFNNYIRIMEIVGENKICG